MKVYKVTAWDMQPVGDPEERHLNGEIYATYEQAQAAAATAAAEAKKEGWTDVTYEAEAVWINVGVGEGGCQAGDRINGLWTLIQELVAEQIAATATKT